MENSNSSDYINWKYRKMDCLFDIWANLEGIYQNQLVFKTTGQEMAK